MAFTDTQQVSPFDIPGQLLAGPGADWRWNNLGYWPGASCYASACQQLALLHADVLSLQSQQRLLELACGYGAGLELWQRAFGITDYHALELRQQCVDHLVNRQGVPAARVSQRSFALCKGTPPWQGWFDAVICVDAAYHAPSVADFADTLTQALAPGGAAAFSTLLKAHSAEPFWHQQLRRMAGIPDASLVTEADLRQTLAARGLEVMSVQYLEHAVFKGFSDWVSQRHDMLDWRQRTSLSWLKVLATARWCRYLSQRPLLRYGLVHAVRVEA
ncbi:MAG: class I SAM-dependent methyltransferase [Marinobacter sp.]|nr:class I SAM-dependent methyltransferase [Marinobacter sp.]